MELSDEIVLNRSNDFNPSDEKKRMRILKETHILDQDSKDQSDCFDSYTSLLCRVFKVPIALVTIIDLNHVLLKSKINWKWGDEVPRQSSFSSHVIKEESPSIVMAADCSLDPRFLDLPNVTGSAHFRFFAGTPIMCEGRKLGAVCVFDTVPHHDIEQKKLDVLLEVGKMVSDYISEKRLRHIHVNIEQIQYLVGITHQLIMPKEHIKYHFYESKRLYKRWKNLLDILQKNKVPLLPPDSILKNNDLRDLIYKTIKRLKSCIQRLSQFVVCMSRHIDMSLKLAYVSFETKLGPTSLDLIPQQNIFNPILHPNRSNQRLTYRTFNQLAEFLNTQLYPERMLFSKNKQFCHDLLTWEIKHNELTLPSTQISVDEELISLVLHSILKPLYQQQEARKSFSKISLKYEISMELKPMTEKDYNSLIRSSDDKSRTLTTSDLMNSGLQYLMLTISPKSPEIFKQSFFSEEEHHKQIDLATSTEDNNVIHSNFHISEYNSHLTNLLVRQNSQINVNNLNLVEFCEQSLLRDLLHSSNGGLEIYRFKQENNNILKTSCSLPEENSVSYIIEETEDKHFYKVWFLCLSQKSSDPFIEPDFSKSFVLSNSTSGSSSFHTKDTEESRSNSIDILESGAFLSSNASYNCSTNMRDPETASAHSAGTNNSKSISYRTNRSSHRKTPHKSSKTQESKKEMKRPIYSFLCRYFLCFTSSNDLTSGVSSIEEKKRIVKKSTKKISQVAPV